MSERTTVNLADLIATLNACHRAGPEARKAARDLLEGASVRVYREVRGTKIYPTK